MYQQIIIALSAFATLACAMENQCDCGVLSSCVESRRANWQSEFSNCHLNCRQNLGDAVDEAEACFQENKNLTSPFEDWMNSCLTNETSGLCDAAPAQGRMGQRLARRRMDRCDTNSKRRINSPSNYRLDEELLLYKACMKQCFMENRTENSTSQNSSAMSESRGMHQRGGMHQHGRMQGNWLFKKCSEEQNCTLNMEAEKAAEQSCKQKSGFTNEISLQIKKELCECLSNAFNIDPSEMQCEKPVSEQKTHEEMIVIFIR